MPSLSLPQWSEWTSPKTLDYIVSETLERMFAGRDSYSSELLLPLVERVFKETDLISGGEP